VADLPADGQGFISFGSFSSFGKITQRVLDLWAEILRATPRSRLVLKASSLRDAPFRDRLTAAMNARGIEGSRLQLIPFVGSTAEHLAQYRLLDIALDPFPYNGATTSCEAMWMGVPVVTLAGKMHAGRVGVSLLANLGLDELIAQTPAEYVTIANRLAGDRDRLRELRRGLRDRMSKSPLMDAETFTRNLERAYRRMWQHHGR
jgi:protein O-GlcNAc transferase